jgi:hypothetical protein
MATELIRWEPAGEKTIYGFAGSLKPVAFQIWTGGAGFRWQLVTQLPGMEDVRPESADPEELKAEADRILREFTSSLGALFAGDLREHLEREARTHQELGDDYDERGRSTSSRGYWSAAQAYRDVIKYLDHELESR